MKILGIDASINSTAACITDEKGKDPVFLLVSNKLAKKYQPTDKIQLKLLYKRLPTEYSGRQMQGDNKFTRQLYHDSFVVERAMIVANLVKDFYTLHNSTGKEKHIDYIILEGIAYSANGNALADTGQLAGIIKAQIHGANYKPDLPLFIVPATSIKLAFTGSGNALKTDVIMTAYKKYKLDFSVFGRAGEDIADSFAICVGGYKALQKRKLL